MTISGGELLEKVKTSFPKASIRAAFPFLRVRLVSKDFDGLTDDERESTLATRIGLDIAEFRRTTDRLFVRFELLSDASAPVGAPRRGETWLGSFADENQRFDPPANLPRVVHFYGYKGGQGRSTLLAFFANSLAAEGY
ncbi:MAG TPA: hypothetical protein VHV77_14780, partial [Pirellulales bacterium]|nr:hypothetical protein [Pirellulales bacterium]